MNASVTREKKSRSSQVSRVGGVEVFQDGVVWSMPGSIANIDAFREWVESDQFPDTGSIWWLDGKVWIDMSKEQAFTHIDVKGAIFAVLYFLVNQHKLGRVFTDGFLFTSYEADISGNPDGLFLSNGSIAAERARLIPGVDGGIVEVQGSPDMALEVVSSGSVKKDTVTLMKSYWKAGVSEYWLVDARQDPLRFEIHRRSTRGYLPSPKKHGWVASEVFGRSFRLSMANDENGLPEYNLEVR